MGVGYRVRGAMARTGLRLLKASGWYDGYWNHWRGEIFEEAEALGLHVMPAHYYSPIPMRVERDGKAAANSMAGVPLDLDAAARTANALLGAHRDGIARLVAGGAEGMRYDPLNEAFHPLDAALLYATILSERPRRIIEIGSGNSTFVTANAVRDVIAAGVDAPEVTCIDPFVPAYLKPAPAGITRVREQPLQEVPLDVFTSLAAGDILFIDSTHVVRRNSDVLYEILEILPRLAEGVIVHVHDIFLPNDYPDDWLRKGRFFWTEQYMLQAFLSMNPNYRIDIPAGAVRERLDAGIRDVLEASGSDVSPGSFWMRRV